MGTVTAAPETPTRGYGPLLRTPGALRFTVAGLVGRMPISMLGIGTFLLVQDRRDSYALAGLVSAAYALGLAGLGPLVSRLVDRRGQRRVDQRAQHDQERAEHEHHLVDDGLPGVRP